MERNELPLNETSIGGLFVSGEVSTYEIPIYQRNYAWGKDEIGALIQDVYDAFSKERPAYYIGTLVSFYKGDRVFEIIDGQQRLTTIFLTLSALNVQTTSKLTYRARKKSDDTLRNLKDFDVDEIDRGIKNGFEFAKTALDEIVPDCERANFTAYFQEHVRIIHYRVPKDIDLNHYFEIMNSRGEQLEKHEIVKAKLMERLPEDEKPVFNWIWESCSEMSVYVQRSVGDVDKLVFGNSLGDFVPKTFEELKELNEWNERKHVASIEDMLNAGETAFAGQGKDADIKDAFQPIIDFPNFLLIVLKLTEMTQADFNPIGFNLDDKELLNEFDAAKMEAEEIRLFAYRLLKARFLLDNYVVHHSKEEDTLDSNPWKLQKWCIDTETKKGRLKNLCEDDLTQQANLVHLLSMFEVSFTARQRKNYLFYTLLFLMDVDLSRSDSISDYARFMEGLAKRYFNEVYMDAGKLNARNTPLPGSFDETILYNGRLRNDAIPQKSASDFSAIFGDGAEASAGVPLFVFNYLDYRLWSRYCQDLRGEKSKEGSPERKAFFTVLGCQDFGLKVFDQFYFSRTRRSLEHYYAQANVDNDEKSLSQDQINCFGNYAMIGSEANSSGSNWSPKTKLDHYLDSSGKIAQISVASLKFMVMMQICKDNQKWEFDEIRNHQSKMISLML